MTLMEISEKPKVPTRRVIHGPHRLRMSGVAPLSPVPAEEVIPTVDASNFEIVTTAVEISVELIPLDEPK